MWLIILSLLLIGLILIMVEIIFIPGTTIVGLLGAFFSIAGIVTTYSYFGSIAGSYALGGTVVLTFLLLLISFRTGMWARYSLKTAIVSKVNEGITASLQVGEVGKAISTLRPFGKGEFKTGVYEVKTSGGYIDNGKEIRITHIDLNQIIVEPTN